MKKIILLVISLTLVCGVSFGQKKKKSKDNSPKEFVDIDLRESDIIKWTEEIYTFDTNGFALIFVRKVESGKSCLGLIKGYNNVPFIRKFNNNMNLDYEADIAPDESSILYKILKHENSLFLLFAKPNMVEFNAVEFNILTKKTVSIDVTYDKPTMIFSMIYKDNSLLLYGTNTFDQKKIRNQLLVTMAGCLIPAFFGSLDFPYWQNVGRVDLKKKKFENFRIDEFGKKPHTYFMASSSGTSDGPASMVFKVRNKGTRMVYAKTISHNGTSLILGENIELEQPPKLEYYTSNINSSTSSEKVVFGNYGRKKQELNLINSSGSFRMKGAYITGLSGKRIKWSSTFDYKKTIPKGHYKRFVRGLYLVIPLNFRGIEFSVLIQRPELKGTQLNFHQIYETENTYYVIGETRYAKWKYAKVQKGELNVNSRNGGIGSTKSKNDVRIVKVLDSWICNGYLIAAYDKTGKELWVKTIKFKKKFITSDENKKFLSIYPDGNKLAISYLNGTEINVNYIDEDNTFNMTPVVLGGSKIPTQNKGKDNNNKADKDNSLIIGYQTWLSDTHLLYKLLDVKNPKSVRKERYGNGKKKGKYSKVLKISRFHFGNENLPEDK